MSELQEGETLGFRESWTAGALEDLAALSNHLGGILRVGVRSDGKVTGYGGGEDDVRRIAGQIVEVLGITPSILMQEIEGKPVLEVRVAPALLPVALKGRYLVRSADSNRESTPEALARRVMKRLGQTWDVQPSERTINDTDQKAIKRFLKLARERLSHLEDNETSERLLEHLDLFFRKDSLTHAGVLLFGNQPQRAFPSAQIHFGRFGDAGILEDATIAGDLFSQLEGAMERFRSCLQIQAPGNSDPDASPCGEIWEYPPEALREALVNALVHRDYTASGEIQVRVYGDRVEIWSPGGLPDGISLEDLRREGHASRPRNPLLAQAFYAGPVERWGTGTLRMIRSCTGCDLPEPQFTFEYGGIKVAFRKDPYAAEKLQTLGLNDRQVQAMVHLKAAGSLHNKLFQEITGASKRTASRDMEDLLKRGLLQRVGHTGRGTKYVLAGLQKSRAPGKTGK